ncbi:MAG: TRAP transporter substrate-binding protein DctP [Hyphomicrobiaceae bacterium]|nr:TRAP transporter substrate-binding protein DctP [Hyphomicrobiaceae bacterium]
MLCIRRIVLALVLHLPLVASAQAQQVKLRITLQQPVTTHIGVNLMRFKEEVEKSSAGEIGVEIFDNSRLYKDNQALGAVASGAIEMASLTAQQFNAKVPAIAIFEQPFLMNFEALVRAASAPDSGMRKLLDAAIIEATGTRPLWWQSYGSSVFIAKNGRRTNLPSGITGQKVRVFGEVMGSFVKHCGAQAHLISASQQVQAMKDGAVDMIMSGIATVPARELWNVSDTITRTEHAALEWLVIINDKFWQSLSPRHQEIIHASGLKVEKELRDQVVEIEKKAYDTARQKGMKVYELTPDEVAEWRACSAPLLESYMETGGELATRLMAAYGKLRTDPCCSAAPGGGVFLGR